MILHPLPLLTAIGNGQGGGDYYGINQSVVGKWFWDELSISTSAPEEYEGFKIIFYE